MCVIIVYGVPDKTSQETLKKLNVRLIKAAHGVLELGLKPKDITCLFPKDLMRRGLDSEITILVVGLFNKSDRTENARKEFAESLENEARKLFPDSELIQCQIHSFDPRWGFAYSFKKEQD